MNQYRTAGVLDENALREISKYFIARWRKWVAWGAAVIFGVSALLALSAQDFVFALGCTLLAVFFAFAPKRFTKQFLNANVARLQESYPGGARQMESYFDEEGAVILNRDNSGEGRLYYPALAQVVETEHYFFLSSKANQFFLVFKDYLAPEQRNSFLPFLKGKCPKLKVVR